MRVIAITGVATAGKDLMCSLLRSGLEARGFSAKRFALADELKEKLKNLLWTEFKIDIFFCTQEEKSLVRPLMVSFGKIAREISDGKYWTNILEKKILQEKALDFAIVTDVRYDEFEEDEVFWVKNKMGGVMIHVRRFENGKVIEAPNEDERKNDPILEEKSDFSIEWETDLGMAEAVAEDLIERILKHE